MKKKFRIPRKSKKKIPMGMYCYKGINMDWSTGIYHIKTCPFYGHIKIQDLNLDETWEKWQTEFANEIVGYCKLIKCQIDDQCKSCGTNYGKL